MLTDWQAAVKERSQVVVVSFAASVIPTKVEIHSVASYSNVSK
jgi:hypothetical protein